MPRLRGWNVSAPDRKPVYSGRHGRTDPVVAMASQIRPWKESPELAVKIGYKWYGGRTSDSEEGHAPIDLFTHPYPSTLLPSGYLTPVILLRLPLSLTPLRYRIHLSGDKVNCVDHDYLERC